MSSTYRIQTGDTYETISRRVYGTSANAELIRSANPGLFEPLLPGLVVITPRVRDDLGRTIDATELDEVAIRIDGTRFRFWEEAAITRSLDTADTLQLTAPFEPERPDLTEVFRPFSYKDMDVLVGGSPLFTGTLVSVMPSVTPSRNSLQIGGYSLPGVLSDCVASPNSYPLEFESLDVVDIARILCEPYGIRVEVDPLTDTGDVFEYVSLAPSGQIMAFLSTLCAQRGLVMGSTERGALLFWQAIETGDVVAELKQGDAPLVSVVPAFNPQEFYSHVTGIEPAGLGTDGIQETVLNPALSGVLRPYAYTVPDAEQVDVAAAVRTKAGRMFANAASYTVNLSTWRDINGGLWRPNTFVSIEAPKAMIYAPYKFLIRTVELTRRGKQASASLNVVIPGAFRGTLPEAFPWDL